MAKDSCKSSWAFALKLSGCLVIGIGMEKTRNRPIKGEVSAI
jgi:hypothetical protein